MFVSPEDRGKRIGAMILEELESWAAELGFAAAMPETGVRRPEATALYRRLCYERIPNYGPYADVYDSVCFRKELSS